MSLEQAVQAEVTEYTKTQSKGKKCGEEREDRTESNLKKHKRFKKECR